MKLPIYGYFALGCEQMPSCTFFGHRDCPDDVKTSLMRALCSLITEQGVCNFYVGNQGNFDALALSALRELKKVYPNITYTVVLAYYPPPSGVYDPLETIFPDEVACAPRRFAIDRRNRFLLAQSDYVICYVQHTASGAARFTSMAQRQGKTVIRL